MNVFSLDVSILYLINAEKIAEVNSFDRMRINQAIAQAIKHDERLERLRNIFQFHSDSRNSAQQFFFKLYEDDSEMLRSSSIDSTRSLEQVANQAE